MRDHFQTVAPTQHRFWECEFGKGRGNAPKRRSAASVYSRYSYHGVYRPSPKVFPVASRPMGALPALVNGQVSSVLSYATSGAAGLGRIFNFMLRLTLGLDYKHTQCGFKAFRNNAAQLSFPCKRSNVGALTRRFSSWRAKPVSQSLKFRSAGRATIAAASMEVLAVRWHSLTGKYADRTNLGSTLSITATQQTSTTTE